MSLENVPGTDFKYALISFDANGRERAEDSELMSARVIDQAANGKLTNVFFFCHGWKGDVPAAKDQYNRWIGALMKSQDLARAKQVFPDFSPLLIGLHWPSQPWGDEELDTGSFGAPALSGEQLLRSYLDRLGDNPAIRGPLEIIIGEARRNAATESLPPTMREAYRQLNDALGLKSGGVEAPPDADRAPFDPDESAEGAQSFGGINLGGVLGPLRQLSYWTMKKRGRAIGESAMHPFLVNLMNATADRPMRTHLMGHSFGTIVVSSMIGGPNSRGPLPRPVDSLMLVQGAVSLWSYASAIPYHEAGPGYYNPIVADRKVGGPIVITRSVHDNACGEFYPLASQVKGSVEFAPEQFPEFGALGAFGAQGIVDATRKDMDMLHVGSAYDFAKQRVYNLESSKFIAKGGGASGAHSDIDGPEVAHAIWEAAFASK